MKLFGARSSPFQSTLVLFLPPSRAEKSSKQTADWSSKKSPFKRITVIKIIQLTTSTSTTHQCTLLILIKDNQCVPLLTLSVTSCCTKLTGSTQDQSRFNQQKVSFEGGNLSLVTGDLAQGNNLLKDELRIKDNSHCEPTYIARAQPPGYPK